MSQVNAAICWRWPRPLPVTSWRQERWTYDRWTRCIPAGTFRPWPNRKSCPPTARSRSYSGAPFGPTRDGRKTICKSVPSQNLCRSPASRQCLQQCRVGKVWKITNMIRSSRKRLSQCHALKFRGNSNPGNSHLLRIIGLKSISSSWRIIDI